MQHRICCPQKLETPRHVHIATNRAIGCAQTSADLRRLLTLSEPLIETQGLLEVCGLSRLSKDRKGHVAAAFEKARTSFRCTSLCLQQYQCRCPLLVGLLVGTDGSRGRTSPLRVIDTLLVRRQSPRQPVVGGKPCKLRLQVGRM